MTISSEAEMSGEYNFYPAGELSQHLLTLASEICKNINNAIGPHMYRYSGIILSIFVNLSLQVVGITFKSNFSSSYSSRKFLVSTLAKLPVYTDNITVLRTHAKFKHTVHSVEIAMSHAVPPATTIPTNRTYTPLYLLIRKHLPGQVL
jgi:hypothetical protein